MESFCQETLDWRDLCEQASQERDPEKLIEIVQRLNDALESRRHRPPRGVLLRSQPGCQVSLGE